MAGVARDRARTLLAGFHSEHNSSVESAPGTRQVSTGSYFNKIFAQAGLSEDAGMAYLKRASMIAAIVGAALCFIKFKIGIAAFVIILLISYLKLRGLIGKRAEAFERDYPTFLLSLASAVRTGLDPIQAFTDATALFANSSELRKELALTKVRLESGYPEDESIRSFASSIAHPDIDLFRTGFILARKEGSSLGECLERLARVTRARQTFRRKIKSAVAMQKMSAVGVGGCALLVLAIQFVSNPETFTKTLSNPSGRIFLSLGAFLVVGGIVWMFRMTRGRV